MTLRLAAIVCACVLDALLGDPYRMPHIIRLIGSLIAWLEPRLRRAFPATPQGERFAGMSLVVAVVALSCGGTCLALVLAHMVSPWLAFVVEVLVSYQMLAARQLAIEAQRVRRALVEDGLEAGRAAVSMIVGRDTDRLDEAGVIRATVETVAENASDGFVAPLCFLALGGAVGGVLYKAVNTMDSMVGYRNETYRNLGTAAARLDDALNWLPARLTGVLMCLVAPLVGLDGVGAWHVFRRDRLKHASPNSAHPEAACAGALGVRLAGPTSYFGVVHDKPTIGDDIRPMRVDDIDAACRLLAATACAALALVSCALLAIAQVRGCL